jgi:hypothetical protein
MPLRAPAFEPTRHLPMLIPDSDRDMALDQQTRGHAESDFGRYLFCAAFEKVTYQSPNVSETPEPLVPSRKSWESGAFADRLRVKETRNSTGTATNPCRKAVTRFPNTTLINTGVELYPKSPDCGPF